MSWEYYSCEWVKHYKTGLGLTPPNNNNIPLINRFFKLYWLFMNEGKTYKNTNKVLLFIMMLGLALGLKGKV